MCGYLCIGCIDFMLAGKKLTYYTSLFSSHDFKKNNNIILIVLSATSSGVSIISFTSIVCPPVGIASTSLTLIFSQTTGIV